MFQHPQSFQRRTMQPFIPPDPFVLSNAAVSNSTLGAFAHQSHPDFLHLAGLVSEAVLEVVFVALPGFVVAITGMFDANAQRMVAELNTMVFTPCLIFTKLAGQLNADKLLDLAIIPLIFLAQTLFSYLGALVMAYVFGFRGKSKRMQKNFVLAMSVFGNSNSLPISLVLSLSKTVQGLHWDLIPGDNDDDVAARGILYLLIFQQLGQMLRWTWGYNVLLKPASAYEDEDRQIAAEEHRGVEEARYSDHDDNDSAIHTNADSDQANHRSRPRTAVDSEFNSGQQTPVQGSPEVIPAAPDNGNNISTEPRNLVRRNDSDAASHRSASSDEMTVFPSFSRTLTDASDASSRTGWKVPLYRVKDTASRTARKAQSTLSTFSHNLFRAMPTPVQRVLSFLNHYNTRFWSGVWRQMNPPLWAMLAALLVASVPKLQYIFFAQGTFVNNSVTRAISQTGGVAVPLILVVLGANLARSTIPKEQLATSSADKKEERRLLFAALLGRMVLPIACMAPLLALTAKLVSVSILDDPIFIVVCFLLAGAPSALQLAQICQINNVFMGAMSSLLVASYVVVIFPSTLLLVLMALETVEWAA